MSQDSKVLHDNVQTHNWKDVQKVEKIASSEIKKYLESLPQTIRVLSVENDKAFQKMDVDFLWVFQKNGIVEIKKIEVKGDTYSHTGNLFFETVSNISKNTPGCFIYSKADYFYYYFIDTRELNILPLAETRKWFVENIRRFPKKKTSTILNNGDRYYSWGRLINKTILEKEVKIKRKVI